MVLTVISLISGSPPLCMPGGFLPGATPLGLQPTPRGGFCWLARLLGIAQDRWTTGLLQRNWPLFRRHAIFLSWYLIAHWIGQPLHRLNGEAGYGNVTVLTSMPSVMVFLFAFRRYGSSKHIAALGLSPILRCCGASPQATIVIYLFSTFSPISLY